MLNRIPGILALEDGTCFTGISVGHDGISAGEVVFNTAMFGYQEIITDNSYCGQIVTMTAPQIGNTGINSEDHESDSPKIKGLLMREISTRVSNWRASESLDDYLKRNKIVALSEIDTRSLTQHIR
ncbi:MAG: carbamoyl phosphate synthase small subunit, partial [Planctomycetaceae bacterium]|nr:carbamoyl phosphate synthase small subunit [Planctomycetaceae bacterium]